MKSIIIIIPYFGKFPNEFQFWLNSAYQNKSIDFVIFTDQYLITRDNVKVVNISFKELRLIFQEKFDFPICLEHPYKLCDYKPAYGFIFDTLINSYDFWGYCDIDLIFGNIRYFIDDSMLSKYQVISGWGHFTLYKNTYFCNNFFKTFQIGFKYYKDAFQTNSHYNFCEYLHKGVSDLWKYLYPNLIIDHKYFDDILIPRLNFNFISVFNSNILNNLIFEYEFGDLNRIYTIEYNQIVKQPTLYVHFQQRKFMKIYTNNLNHFIVIPNAFIEFTPLNYNLILSYNRNKDFKRILWNFQNKVIRRFKKINSILLKTSNY